MTFPFPLKISFSLSVPELADYALPMAAVENRKRFGLICLLSLALITLGVVLQPLRGYEFNNFDDDQYLTSNPHVQAGFTSASVRWAFTSGYAANWHPLTWLCAHPGLAALRPQPRRPSPDQPAVSRRQYAAPVRAVAAIDRRHLAQRLRGRAICVAPHARGVRRVCGRTQGRAQHFVFPPDPLDLHPLRPTIKNQKSKIQKEFTSIPSRCCYLCQRA